LSNPVTNSNQTAKAAAHILKIIFEVTIRLLVIYLLLPSRLMRQLIEGSRGIFVVTGGAGGVRG
jgi:hypothetical protein